MKLYRDKDNNVYAYEEDGSQDHLIDGKIAITQAEADEIIAAQQSQALAAMNYSEKRQQAYPSIGEQLDALYHAGVFPADMAERIRAVKQQYPKP